MFKLIEPDGEGGVQQTTFTNHEAMQLHLNDDHYYDCLPLAWVVIPWNPNDKAFNEGIVDAAVNFIASL